PGPPETESRPGVRLLASPAVYVQRDVQPAQVCAGVGGIMKKTSRSLFSCRHQGLPGRSAEPRPTSSAAARLAAATGSYGRPAVFCGRTTQSCSPTPDYEL